MAPFTLAAEQLVFKQPKLLFLIVDFFLILYFNLNTQINDGIFGQAGIIGEVFQVQIHARICSKKK